MTAVQAAEVRPGLVVHLDTAVLRSLGGSEANAEVAGTGDSAIAELESGVMHEGRKRSAPQPKAF